MASLLLACTTATSGSSGVPQMSTESYNCPVILAPSSTCDTDTNNTNRDRIPTATSSVLSEVDEEEGCHHREEAEDDEKSNNNLSTSSASSSSCCCSSNDHHHHGNDTAVVTTKDEVSIWRNSRLSSHNNNNLNLTTTSTETQEIQTTLSCSSSCENQRRVHQSRPQHHHHSHNDDDEQLLVATCSSSSSSSVVVDDEQKRLSWQQSSIGRRTVSIVQGEFDHVVEQSPYLKRHYAGSIPIAGTDNHHPNNSSSSSTTTTTALFHRSEIVIGRCLGQGGFSNVYEILAFQLRDDMNEQLTSQQRLLRHRYAQDCIDPMTGLSKYAIKHVKERLMKKPGRNQQQHQQQPSSSPSLAAAAPPKQAPVITDNNENNANSTDPSLQNQEPSKKTISTATTTTTQCCYNRDFHNAVVDLAVEAAYMLTLSHDHIMQVRGLPLQGICALQDGKHDGYFIIMDCLQIGKTLEQRIYKDWTVRDHVKREKEHFFATFTPPMPAATIRTQHTTNNHHQQHHVRRHSHHGSVYELHEHHHDNIHANDDSLEQKVSYALQLANALQYLHSHNIIFRDIKPHNIGFVSTTHHTPSADDDDEVGYCGGNNNNVEKLVLFDFGLCRELPPGPTMANYYKNNNTEDALLWMSGVGTRRYMAPEIILTSNLGNQNEHVEHSAPAGAGNLCRYNLKADVYSWSMVFWEMLTLSKPYPGYSCEQHKIQVCENGERPPLFNWSNNNSDCTTSLSQQLIPRSIQHVLKRSWEPEIDKRLSMKQVCEALEAYLTSCESSSTTALIGQEEGLAITMVTTGSISHGDYSSFDCDDENVPPPLPSFFLQTSRGTPGGLAFPAYSTSFDFDRLDVNQASVHEGVNETEPRKDGPQRAVTPTTGSHFAFYLNLPSVPLPEVNGTSTNY